MKAEDLIISESQPAKSFKYDTLSVILIGMKYSRNYEGIVRIFYNLNAINVGLGRIIAGNYFLWNAGLKAGVIPFYVSNIFWSIGVTCMSLCLAEMASALPFTGGVYGFARGLIGPYIGFLVGICEFVGNIVLLGTLSIAFGQSVSTTLGLHDLYILPFFLVPLAIAALLQYTGSKHFGFVVKYLSLLSVILFAIYVFGSMAHVSFPRYGNNSHGHPSSMTHKINQALSSSNFGCSFFIGMESIPVISSAAKKPHESIPRSLFITTIFYYVSFTAVIFLASWQRPGTNEVEKAALPLSYGYANIFGISDEAAAIFSAPAALTSCVVCTYYMCVTLRSMAQSGVLPSCVAKVARFKSLFCPWGSRSCLLPSSEPKMNGALETVMEGVPAKEAVNEKGTIAIHTNITAKPMNLGIITAHTVKNDAEEGEDEEEVPYVALGIVVTGTAITTVLVLCGLLFYVDFAYSVILFGLYSFWFIYFAVFATYLVYCSRYREKQNHTEERFKSPLGVYGAVLGMVVTVCMIFVSNYPYLAYQLYTLLIFIASLIILSVVYVKVMVHYQRYSPEEEKVFFIAFIIRANRKLKENMRKGGFHHRQHHAHLFNMNYSNSGSPSSYHHSQDIEANNQHNKQHNKNSSYSSHRSYIHNKPSSFRNQPVSSLRKPVASPHNHSCSMFVNAPTLEKPSDNPCSNSNKEGVSSDTSSVLSHVWYFLQRRVWFAGSGGVSPAVVAVSSELSADSANHVSQTNKLPLPMTPSNATLQETSGSVSERVSHFKKHSEDNQVTIFSAEDIH